MSQKSSPLEKSTRKILKDYFSHLDDASQAREVYTHVLQQVEKPMLKIVLKKADGNKSKAAKMLGINRNTLHKKLIQYEISKS